MFGLDVFRLMVGAAEMWVMVNGLVVDPAHLPRCQVAEVTSALEVPIVWRGVGRSLLHLDLSEHLGNAFAVSYDAVEASGNANDDLERLQENIGYAQRMARALGLRNLPERRRGDHDRSSRLRLLELRRGGLLRRRSRS
jgi:hypothetical protein